MRLRPSDPLDLLSSSRLDLIWSYVVQQRLDLSTCFCSSACSPAHHLKNERQFICHERVARLIKKVVKRVFRGSRGVLRRVYGSESKTKHDRVRSVWAERRENGSNGGCLNESWVVEVIGSTAFWILTSASVYSSICLIFMCLFGE